MAEPGTESNNEGGKEGKGPLIGLFALSASNLIVEISLTKFVSFKLFNHMTYAILCTVILCFGAAGIICYQRLNRFPKASKEPWNLIGRSAALYAISLCIVIPIFCWFPLNPYDCTKSEVLRAVSLLFLFTLLAIPFYFAGVSISQTLTFSKRPVTIIYSCDLLAAALGACICPSLLQRCGGYGTMALSSLLGLIAALAYWTASRKYVVSKQFAFMIAGIISIGFCLLYPSWATKNFGIDIRIFKLEVGRIFVSDFGGANYTHWNEIARVDVSKTGTSRAGVFRYGLSSNSYNTDILGRYILLDGGASTRQFKIAGAIKDQDYLATALWASPYIAHPLTKEALVIGGGGGIDILVGKYFDASSICVVEMNPALYKILTGKWDDPNNFYYPWLKSSEQTKVTVVNDEARHFCSTLQEPRFDIIQASGVDTLTAIQTGGMSLVENYLYTTDAVKEYMRLLKPDGILSLTHWRTNSAATSLRMFLTYLQVLDSLKISQPWRYVAVVAGDDWTDLMLKKQPFSNEELERLRTWVQRAGMVILFDPGNPGQIPKQPRANEFYYSKLGFASAEDRYAMISRDKNIPVPVTDDKPYFYQFTNQDPNFWVLNQTAKVPLILIIVALIGSTILVLYPFSQSGRINIPKPILWSGIYFAISGFAFLLYETAIIQMFSIFVGGPIHALGTILVAVLAGYSFGSWCASIMKVPERRTFLFYAGGLFLLFLVLYAVVPLTTHSLLFCPLLYRNIICGLLVSAVSACIGLVVSSAMNIVRNEYKYVVSWMWGVSSVFNGLGSLFFVPVTQSTGIASCLLFVAGAFLCANLIFVFRGPFARYI
jgi:spermidine synthase